MLPAQGLTLIATVLTMKYYFYEQHIGHAVYYCNIIKNFPKWSILASPIEAEIVIDLMNPDDYNEFEKIARRLENSYKKRRDGRARRLLNAVVLNTIYKLRTYDMARGCFNFPNTNYVPRANVRLRHIQLCVRNLDCIKSIDEVVTHG